MELLSQLSLTILKVLELNLQQLRKQLWKTGPPGDIFSRQMYAVRIEIVIEQREIFHVCVRIPGLKDSCFLLKCNSFVDIL